jgi:hypothetical protein
MPTSATLATKKSAKRASCASDVTARNARVTKPRALARKHAGASASAAQSMTLAGCARTRPAISLTQVVYGVKLDGFQLRFSAYS